MRRLRETLARGAARFLLMHFAVHLFHGLPVLARRPVIPHRTIVPRGPIIAHGAVVPHWPLVTHRAVVPHGPLVTHWAVVAHLAIAAAVVVAITETLMVPVAPERAILTVLTMLLIAAIVIAIALEAAFALRAMLLLRLRLVGRHVRLAVLEALVEDVV